MLELRWHMRGQTCVFLFVYFLALLLATDRGGRVQGIILRERRYTNARLALGKEYDEIVVAYHDDLPLNMVSASKNLSTKIYQQNVPWHMQGGHMSLMLRNLRKLDWILFDRVYYWIAKYSVPRTLFQSGFLVYGVFTGLLLYKFYINLYKGYDGKYPDFMFTGGAAGAPLYILQLDAGSGKHFVVLATGDPLTLPDLVYQDVQQRMTADPTLTLTKQNLFAWSLALLSAPAAGQVDAITDDAMLRELLEFIQFLVHDKDTPAHMVAAQGKLPLWSLVKSFLFLEAGFLIQHVVYQGMLIYYDKPSIGDSLKKMSEFFIYHKTHDEMLLFMASNLVAGAFYRATCTVDQSFWASTLLWSILYFVIRRGIRFLTALFPDHPFYSLAIYLGALMIGTARLIEAKEGYWTRWQRSLYWQVNQVNRALGQPHTVFVKDGDFASSFWRRCLNPANQRTYWYVQGAYTTLLLVVPIEIIYFFVSLVTAPKPTAADPAPLTLVDAASTPAPAKPKKSIFANVTLFKGTRALIRRLWNLLRLDFRVSAIPIVHGCATSDGTAPHEDQGGFDAILSFIDQDLFKGLPVFENAFGAALVIIIILGQYASEFSF